MFKQVLRAKINRALLGAALAACVASYIAGRVHQKQLHDKRIADAEMAAFETASEISLELEIAKETLLEQQAILEKAAHEDTNTNGHCFPASRVRRLNLR